ncbi:MAG: hypothetical protein ACTIA6_11000 [Pseudoclavibacter sp.]
MRKKLRYSYAERRERQASRAAEWLEEKWTQPSECPICGTDDWSWEEPGGLPTIGREMYEGTPDTVPGDLPIWSLICKNCGLTHFFNGLRTGIIQLDDYVFELEDDEVS